MLTDLEIRDLIEMPKSIITKTPARGYVEENGHKRCDLELKATSDYGARFVVFIRRHVRFIENFSIGLRYQTGDSMLGTITLVRYNGPHGESSIQLDGHYAKPHIHTTTADELASGSTQPQETHREITDSYSTYEEAIRVFFGDVAVSNYAGYFPEALQGRLFNGPQ